MKHFILPLILLMALGASQFTISNDSPSRSIASLEIEQEDEAPEALFISSVGNDCVECRLAELQIQNMYQMMEMYAMNQVVLSQLSSPQYDPNAPSIMEQMGSYTDQLYASNPLVTGRINNYAMEQDASIHNPLSLSQSILGYGFDYDSYLGNSGSVQSVQQQGFDFSAPPIDNDPAYRRMSEFTEQYNGFEFNNQTNLIPEALIADTGDFYPSEMI